ncbi:MAG: cation-translocating P-type ATPase, partial [Candidatus Lokiarchaeota archaeon]|nr:cation-translocating P-type ATPase [Candidatus Lokiarchaeota archaeon]
MQEHACEHCDSCCNVAPGTIGDANGGRSAFKVHFWKFLSASGLLLAISILIEFSLLPVGGELADLVLAQGLAVASVVLSCHDVFLAALSEIKGRRLGASTLMVVAAVGSFLILHAQEGAMAIWLYSVAEKLEDVSSDRARDAVSKLMELAPDVALLKAGGEVRQVPTRAVKVGDVIVVKPGMKVALDGKVVAGESYFDTHTITGESVPRLRSTGDVVFASSINGDSLVELEVTKASGDTLLDRITDSIRAAQRNKSRTEVFIQRFARYYTPLIFLASISLMVVPWLAFQQEPLPWVYRALILLVISCPCALTLSTPLSMVAALTKLSREGVLVKGGRYIEELDKVGMFGFDKT